MAGQTCCLAGDPITACCLDNRCLSASNPSTLTLFLLAVPSTLTVPRSAPPTIASQLRPRLLATRCLPIGALAYGPFELIRNRHTPCAVLANQHRDLTNHDR